MTGMNFSLKVSTCCCLLAFFFFFPLFFSLVSSFMLNIFLPMQLKKTMEQSCHFGDQWSWCVNCIFPVFSLIFCYFAQFVRGWTHPTLSFGNSSHIYLQVQCRSISWTLKFGMPFSRLYMVVFWGPLIVSERWQFRMLLFSCPKLFMKSSLILDEHNHTSFKVNCLPCYFLFMILPSFLASLEIGQC